MKDCNRAIDDAWRQISEDCDANIAPPARSAIEEFALFQLGFSRDHLDGDPELQRSFVDELARAALPVVKGIRKPHGHGAPHAQGRAGSTTSKPKPKSLERQLYLYRYVTSRLGSGARTQKGRVKRRTWQRICGEWNLDHPADRLDNESIARRYSYAKSSADVQFNLALEEYMEASLGMIHTTQEVAGILLRTLDETAALERDGRISAAEATTRRQAGRELALPLATRLGAIRDSLMEILEAKQ